MEWYRLSIEELKDKLNANGYRGLSNSEAENRLEKYGPNELKEEARKSLLSKILTQFKDFFSNYTNNSKYYILYCGRKSRCHCNFSHSNY